MKNLKYLILLLLFFVGASAFAQNSLVIDLRDGSSTTILLNKRPRVTFDDRQINIVSSSIKMEFNCKDVKNWHFTDNSSSIEAVSIDAKFTIEDNTLVISGIKESTTVTLYTINGVVVKQSNSTNGLCTIPLNDIPAGFYITTYNNTTFKFQRK